MGKRIIQQARGKGSSTYRVRRQAFNVKPRYPCKLEGEWVVVNLFGSAGHSAPIAKLRNSKGEIFYNFAGHGLYIGQKITIGGHNVGDVSRIGDLKNTETVFNIESQGKDGGKFIRSGGNFGTIMNKKGNDVTVLMPSKKEKIFNSTSRATIGKLAGGGRLDKPILKAGRKHYMMKAKSKLWPRTSAVKMNAIDHPFGSGRGKRIKSKIAKRNASPGKKVGLLRPRRTGRKKR
jgi:large subunit ribosomal protein L2